MNLSEIGRKYTEFNLGPEDVIASLRNPVVSKTIQQLKSLVLRKPWVVTASNPTIASFVYRVLSPLWNKIILRGTEALIWGFAPMEVIWKIKDVPLPKGKITRSAICLEDLVLLPPPRVTFLADQSSKIVGFRYSQGPGEKIDYLYEKAAWVSHLAYTVNSPYGVPVIALTKPYEELFKDLLELLAVSVENQASPPLLGHAPLKEITIGDQKKSAVDYMAEKLAELKAYGATVIPQEFESGGQALWGIDAPLKLSDTQEITQSVQTVLQLLRIAIFGIEATVVAGHTPQAIPTEDLIASYVFNEILDCLNDTLISNLVSLNWGENEWAIIDAAETGQVDIDLVRDLIRGAIQFYTEGRTDIFGAVDWMTLFDVLGVPTTTGEVKSPVLESLEEAIMKTTMIQPTGGLFAGLTPTPAPQGTSPQPSSEETVIEKALQEAGLRKETSASPAQEGSPESASFWQTPASQAGTSEEKSPSSPAS